MLHRLKAVIWASVLVAVLIMVASAPGQARKYALLVGVSKYPNLEKKFQLAGPDNDVRLIQSVLEQLKVSPDDITILHSSHDNRPTRANIIAALDNLAAKSGPDDFVYLFFAGHGSRQPAREGDTEEEDGLDEIFLPEDVGSWKDEIGAVERAITDNEINRLITSIRANGTFVWAVFDSCHSGTMLRSVNRIKWRKVDPGALGIPSNARTKSRRSKLPMSVDQITSAPPAIKPAPAAKGSGKPGGFVAFYAAQSHQLAPELKMPANAAKPSSHGMFTYQLAQAMMGGGGLTYRQLGQTILQKYVKQGMRATTPLFEGSHLDAPMFGRTNVKKTFQWPVRIRGSRKRRLYVPVGELQQVGKGALFSLHASASDPDEKAIGYAKADLVELFGAQLHPVAHADQPVFDLANLPRTAYARLIKPSFQFGLTVARPDPASAGTQRERRVSNIIEAMAADQMSGNDSKGLQVKWVEAGRSADIHLVFSPPRNAQGDAASCVRNHLWFLDRTGAMICTGSRANLSFRLQNPSASFDANVKKALGDWLNAIGKVRNLEQMVGRFKGGRFARKIKISLFVTRKGGQGETIVDQSSRQPLKDGDQIRLDVTNTSNTPIDLTILFVDSQFGISTLFPSRGRTNRISAGGRKKNIGGRINKQTLGLEGMIVIASKAQDGAPVANFSFLAQKKLSRTKNVRSMGMGRSKPEQQGNAFEDLFAGAAFGNPKKGGTRSAGGRKKAARTPFKNVMIKSVRWLVEHN